MAELSDNILSQIEKRCKVGDDFVENGNYTKALLEYQHVLELIPDPKTDWEATTWVLAAMGDAYFLNNDFQAGVREFSNAMHCPNAIGNPFLHMRLGQCQFELGHLDKAADELTRAYAIEGEQIFEDENPKYFEFLIEKIKIGN